VYHIFAPLTILFCYTVAAIGGIYAVRDGRFPGKIVIYPHITDLPLTPLEELGAVLPTVAARLKRSC
jgi:hypothetical protein